MVMWVHSRLSIVHFEVLEITFGNFFSFFPIPKIQHVYFSVLLLVHFIIFQCSVYGNHRFCGIVHVFAPYFCINYYKKFLSTDMPCSVWVNNFLLYGLWLALASIGYKTRHSRWCWTVLILICWRGAQAIRWLSYLVALGHLFPQFYLFSWSWVVCPCIYFVFFVRVAIKQQGENIIHLQRSVYFPIWVVWTSFALAQCINGGNTKTGL